MQQLMNRPQRPTSWTIPSREVMHWTGWKHAGRGRIEKPQHHYAHSKSREQRSKPPIPVQFDHSAVSGSLCRERLPSTPNIVSITHIAVHASPTPSAIKHHIFAFLDAI